MEDLLSDLICPTKNSCEMLWKLENKQDFDFNLFFLFKIGASLIPFTLEVEARRSNLRHRPVGLGVQGLADAFLMMKMPFESAEAKQLNEE